MKSYERAWRNCLSALRRLCGIISHRHARAVLAEVLRTLETVTPEMSEAGDCAFENGYVHEVYSAMLHASPLTPPKEKSP